MNNNARRIKDYLLSFYPENEWPTLLYQAETWAASKPLDGLRILDATPLYRNTLGKFMALLAAGAEVYVPWKTRLPADETLSGRLEEFGIRRANRGDDFFDIILDCSGQCTRLTPTLGFCELTRSGVPRYERAKRPVFNVDDSRIKQIETTLGTGESFFRALNQLGHAPSAGRRLLVIGYGKVGKGITYYARKNGMSVTVADLVDKSGELPGDIGFASVQDTEALHEAIMHSWCVVTATGRISALRHKLHPSEIVNSPILLANMGVEDEYGSQIPEHRVLNHKQPLNFILDDPTGMRFIETTMALHNACGLDLLTQDLPHRILPPCPDVEEQLLQIALERGKIAEDYKQL